MSPVPNARPSTCRSMGPSPMPIFNGASTIGVTDSTAAIQAVLDQAGPQSPIHVVVDGRFGVTQLRIGGNTTIEALADCGFIQLSNSDRPCVWNRNPTTAGIVDENITIIGGTWNFNGFQDGEPQQARNGLEGLTMGFKFAGVRNVRVRDVHLINCRTIHSFFWNFYDVVFENIVMEMAGDAAAPYNIDGIDFQTGRFLTIRNLVATCKDDAINIGANNGFHTTPPPPGEKLGVSDFEPYACYGPVTDVLIDGVVLKDSELAGIRLISRDQLVDRVTIRNVTGTTKRNWLIIDNYGQWSDRLFGAPGSSTAGNFGDIIVENVHVDVVGGGLTPYICQHQWGDPIAHDPWVYENGLHAPGLSDVRDRSREPHRSAVDRRLAHPAQRRHPERRDAGARPNRFPGDLECGDPSPWRIW